MSRDIDIYNIHDIPFTVIRHSATIKTPFAAVWMNNKRTLEYWFENRGSICISWITLRKLYILFSWFVCAVSLFKNSRHGFIFYYVVNDRVFNGWTFDDKLFSKHLQFVQHFNSRHYLYWLKNYKVAWTPLLWLLLLTLIGMSWCVNQLKVFTWKKEKLSPFL